MNRFEYPISAENSNLTQGFKIFSLYSYSYFTFLNKGNFELTIPILIPNKLYLEVKREENSWQIRSSRKFDREFVESIIEKLSQHIEGKL